MWKNKVAEIYNKTNFNVSMNVYKKVMINLRIIHNNVNALEQIV